MKAYNAFRTQVENIKTEKDLKDAHISICRAYSAYRISYGPFMEQGLNLRGQDSDGWAFL